MNCKCKYPEDDEFGLIQGSGNANLDIFYPCQFVQNEEASFYSKSICDLSYQLVFTPVLPETATGTVYYKKTAVCIFLSKKDGFEIRGIVSSKNLPTVLEVNLNKDTGSLTITWDRGMLKEDSQVIVSYEYNLEVQQNVCPHCKGNLDNGLSLQQLADGSGYLDMY